MNKLKFIGILLVGFALVFTGCEAIIAGLSSEMIDEQAAAIGTGSVSANTWTYNGKYDINLTSLTGNLVVTFSQKVAIAQSGTPAADQDSVKLEYKVTTDDDPKTVIDDDFTTAAGTLSADGLTYTVPLDTFFDALPTATYNGVVDVDYTVTGFISTTEKDPAGDARVIPAVTGSLKIIPIYGIDNFKNPTYMMTGEGKYDAAFTFGSAISVADLAAFTITDANAAKADYNTPVLSADGKTITLTLKTTTGAPKDSMREVTLGIPGVTFLDSKLSAQTLSVKFTVLPVTPAWVPNAKVQASIAKSGTSDQADRVQFTLTLSNVKAPAGFNVGLAGTTIYDATNTARDWDNGRDNFLAAIAADGSAVFNGYFGIMADGSYSGWGRTWDTTVVGTGNVTFCICIPGAWNRVIGCWEDKSQPQDGNFFLDLDDAPAVALGDKITLAINCNDAKDL